MFRSSGVLNFATGGIGMVGAYVYYDLTKVQGWSVAPAVLICVVIGAILGVVCYVAVIVLPGESSNIMRVMGTLGILTILQAAVQLRYGPNTVAIDPFLPEGSLSLGGGVELANSRSALMASAVALTAVLAVIYSRSRFGLATTAVAESERKLAALGWRIGVVGSVNWAVGGALSALAGVLLAPITGVDLSIGTILTVTVLAAALIGGLRSFTLTLIGGLVIGMLQSLFSVQDLGIEGLSEAIPFAVIVGVIIFRGRGLPLRSYIGDRLPKVGTGAIPVPAVIAATVVALILIGPVLNDNGTRALTSTMLTAITLLSFTVLVGYAGQMSLAQVTLGAFAGFIAAKVTIAWDLPFLLALLVGVLGVIPVGLIVGLPSARARGASLAIATLGLAVAIQALVFGNESLSGGSRGLTLDPTGEFTIFGVDFGAFGNVDRYAWLVLGFLVALCLMVANLRRGVAGRHMIAIRGNERAAAGLGINVVSTKLWAFAIAACIAGFSGVISTFRGPAALFSNVSVISNIVSIGYAIVGGVGGALGALFGSLIDPTGAGNALLGLVVDISPVWMAVFGGAMLINAVIQVPNGIAMEVASKFKNRTQGKADAKIQKWMSSAEVDSDHRLPAGTLTVDEITVKFGVVTAVNGVSLTVGPGEIVGVIGANGAGKTTLIDSITGFVAAEGRVRIDDTDLSHLPTHDRARRGLGRSWQTLEIFEDLTVLENLRAASDRREWWAPIADLVRPERSAPSPELLRAVEALGLEPLLGESPATLSTGQRKLVALARAISAGPSILLLDEPCSGLDNDERAEVGRVITMLARELGMGVLLVEHDVALVRELCDNVVALNFGRVIGRGDPDEVLSTPAVAEAFLGSSPTDPAEETVGAPS